MGFFEDDLYITSKWSAKQKYKFSKAELWDVWNNLKRSLFRIWKLWTYKEPEQNTMKMYCFNCHDLVEVINEFGRPTKSYDERAYCPNCHTILGKQL